MATHRHVLISATYDADKAISSRELTRIVREGIEAYDYDLEQIMSYTQSFRVSPMASGLVEVWQNMSEEEHANIPPKLTNAILKLLGVENG